MFCLGVFVHPEGWEVDFKLEKKPEQSRAPIVTVWMDLKRQNERVTFGADDFGALAKSRRKLLIETAINAVEEFIA